MTTIPISEINFDIRFQLLSMYMDELVEGLVASARMYGVFPPPPNVRFLSFEEWLLINIARGRVFNLIIN